MGWKVNLRDLCSPEKKAFAKRLRRNATASEMELWKYLRRKGMGSKFTRQSVIRGWIVDFYCPSQKLIVEVDGNSHIGRESEDARRDRELLKIGLRTVRVRASDVFNNIDFVLKKIIFAICGAPWDEARERQCGKRSIAKSP